MAVAQAFDAGETVGARPPEWKYEMRREAQQILPGLLVGPFQASINLERLKGLGVTHILCVRDTKEVDLIKPRFPEHFVYMTLELEDNDDQNLIRVFPSSTAFIESARAAGGTVLVHCNGGFALSPAIVAGYIIELRQCSWHTAVQFIQSHRYCIAFNPNYENQLKEYEVMCRAKAAMQMYGNPMHADGLVQSKRKASMEDDMPRPAPGMTL